MACGGGWAVRYALTAQPVNSSPTTIHRTNCSCLVKRFTVQNIAICSRCTTWKEGWSVGDWRNTTAVTCNCTELCTHFGSAAGSAGSRSDQIHKFLRDDDDLLDDFAGEKGLGFFGGLGGGFHFGLCCC